MQEPDLFFVIPTYRLREVGETVEQYDEHFWRNGQSVLYGGTERVVSYLK